MNFSGIFWTTSYKSSIFIKIEGWAVQNNSLFFKDFVDQMINEGFEDFVIDLLDCKGMDSTFMGTLLCIVHQVKKDKVPVTLVNSNIDHKKLLGNLGLNNILHISDKSIDIPKSNMYELPRTNRNFISKVKLIREAHQCLMNLNEKNHKLFVDFLDTLEEETQS